MTHNESCVGVPIILQLKFRTSEVRNICVRVYFIGRVFLKKNTFLANYPYTITETSIYLSRSRLPFNANIRMISGNSKIRDTFPLIIIDYLSFILLTLHIKGFILKLPSRKKTANSRDHIRYVTDRLATQGHKFRT